MASVEQRGNSWRGEYRVDGRKFRTPSYPTKRLALQAARDEEARSRSGAWFDPSAGKETFSAYFETQWFPNRQGEVRTKGEYWSCYQASLKDTFGHMELRKIRSRMIQGWVNRQFEQGVSAATIRARFKVLQVCLAAKQGASARRDLLIQFNPCEGVQLPKIPEREVTILEPPQVEAVLEQLDPWWRLLPLFMAETGLRWGEALGLTLEDFSLDYRQVSVRRTIVETKIETTGNGTRFMWKDTTKTRKSRKLALAEDVVNAIKAHVRDRDLGPGDRLFSMPDRPTANWHPPLARPEVLRTDVWPGGVPIGGRYHRQAVWDPAVAAAGMPDRTLRDLRASHISWALAGGANLPAVMERVGHTRFQTTRRYTAALRDADDQVLEALDNLRARYKR
jgi:integrase